MQQRRLQLQGSVDYVWLLVLTCRGSITSGYFYSFITVRQTACSKQACHSAQEQTKLLTGGSWGWSYQTFPWRSLEFTFWSGSGAPEVWSEQYVMSERESAACAVSLKWPTGLTPFRHPFSLLSSFSSSSSTCLTILSPQPIQPKSISKSN